MFDTLIAELHDSKIKIKLSNRVYNILRVSAGHSSEKESESDCACDSASPKFSNKMVRASPSLSIFFESLWILISRIIRVSLSLSFAFVSEFWFIIIFQADSIEEFEPLFDYSRVQPHNFVCIDGISLLLSSVWLLRKCRNWYHIWIFFTICSCFRCSGPFGNLKFENLFSFKERVF